MSRYAMPINGDAAAMEKLQSVLMNSVEIPFDNVAFIVSYDWDEHEHDGDVFAFIVQMKNGEIYLLHGWKDWYSQWDGEEKCHHLLNRTGDRWDFPGCKHIDYSESFIVPHVLEDSLIILNGFL